MCDRRFPADGPRRRACSPRYLANDDRNVVCPIWVSRRETRPHRGGGLRDQLQIVMPRDRPPHSDAGRDVVVAFGAFDQLREAKFGKISARIVDGAFDDFVVASLDQNVGDRDA